MRKSRFTESQIIKVLKEVEGGRQVGEICREYGVSDATYNKWKAKYGGMEVSDSRRLTGERRTVCITKAPSGWQHNPGDALIGLSNFWGPLLCATVDVP